MMAVAVDQVEAEKKWLKKREERRAEGLSVAAAEDGLPDILLPYQTKLVAEMEKHRLLVCEKSRRIGMTWATAAASVLAAATKRSNGGQDVFYMGYEFKMTREFIDTCADFAKAFQLGAASVGETVFKDVDEDGQEKDIKAFEIRFASGFSILALTSSARNLRGRQGIVIIDEAAFHDDVEQVITAALPLTIWGGRVLVISTHNGADNAFNELVQDIRADKQPGGIVKVTFEDAIRDGLYERLKLVLKGRGVEIEPKAEFIEDIYRTFRGRADQELHCIPTAGTGTYMTTAAIEACMVLDGPVARLACPDGFELRPKAERTAFVQTFLDNHVSPLLAQLDTERLCALGQDFGRNVDLTVIDVGHELADLTVTVPVTIELKNTPIEQQFQVLCFVIEALPRFLAAKLDATGNGLGLAERLQEEYGYDRIEAVKLSQSWYLENGPRLKSHIQDQTIQLISDTDNRDDLRAVKLVRGIPTIPEARNKGRHGDGAVSKMMLLAALKMDIEEYDYRGGGRGGEATGQGMFAEDEDSRDWWQPPLGNESWRGF